MLVVTTLVGMVAILYLLLSRRSAAAADLGTVVQLLALAALAAAALSRSTRVALEQLGKVTQAVRASPLKHPEAEAAELPL
jgi:hypothetical protein